jgi:spore coat protein H
MIGREPMFVRVTVHHNGRVWTGVGMRYKGNSSLMSARRSENGKIPFRLDFDQYEEELPETRNQRFYGFQKLTFSSNYSDDSQIREVLATEILRDRGVPAARAAFYRVFVDTGSGPEYWGLYSMVEDPADGAMLDAQFGSRLGNLYKPDGPGADWTRFEAATFEKKNNEKAADYADVTRAIEALNLPQPDAPDWRAGLEAVFDVNHFLRWLAVNTVIQNWDAYGMMPHNYYLYGDPAVQGRLRWIPWDHNMSFAGARGRRGAAPPVPPAPPPPVDAGPRPVVIAFPMGGTDDVLHERVGSQFPLIQRLMADPVYSARYREELERALGGLVAAAPLEQRMRELQSLITSAVIGEHGERPKHTTISSREAFEASVTGPGGLVDMMAQRRELIRGVLQRAREAHQKPPGQ